MTNNGLNLIDAIKMIDGTYAIKRMFWKNHYLTLAKYLIDRYDEYKPNAVVKRIVSPEGLTYTFDYAITSDDLMADDWNIVKVDSFNSKPLYNFNNAMDMLIDGKCKTIYRVGWKYDKDVINKRFTEQRIVLINDIAHLVWYRDDMGAFDAIRLYDNNGRFNKCIMSIDEVDLNAIDWYCDTNEFNME